MAFTTKLDFSDNRQVKQRIETIQNLSGATTFGVAFSALPSGPDLTTSGISITYNSIASTFSGNSGTTNYSWYDTRMSLGESGLSAITPSNSATTQNTGAIFTANTTTTIDGNLINLTYSGVSFDINVTGMTNLGGGNYSGTVNTLTLNIISANTLDFTGRTIWSDTSGITRTERLIVTNNPQVGYVLKCIDTEGMTEWAVDSSGSTGSTTYWSASTNGIVVKDSGSLASGIYSLAEGFQTTASGHSSHAEGRETVASGSTSHAEGYQTTASGTYSHAEGESTIASGNASHAEGRTTIASGIYSHAEGSSTTASGGEAHAEGSSTTASGSRCHAEGVSTTASGNYSHSEGSTTIASGNCSHAEGGGTTASGDYSHAGGILTIASGQTSFVHGSGSTAGGIGTIVLGNNITGLTDNITYVADLIIDGLVSTDPIATDANGMIVAGASDSRLKQNINNLSDSLNIINNLRGVSFEFTEASNMGGGIRYGFIAQEVKEFVPDIVRLRAKGDGMLSLNYNEIVPILVEAVKELSSNELKTQKILAEDNNIDLNYNGNRKTAVGGGITVLHGIDNDTNSELIIDKDGNWITNSDFKSKSLTIPLFTPSSTKDTVGNEGNITRDENYLYLKTKGGWKRTNLESF